jgi:hypothetical protein
MSAHRQTRVNTIKLTLLALLGLGALAGCAGGLLRPAGTVPTSQATESAPTLVDAAAGAVLSAGSVHVDATTISPSGSLTQSADVTASGGRSVITANKTEHVTVLFTGGVAYVEANLAFLENIFEVPATQAEYYWDEWIAVRSGEKLGLETYDDLTNGMTLSSLANQLQICGACTLTSPTTVAGQPVFGVQAPLPADQQAPASARQVLYLTDNAQQRPVLLEARGDGSSTNRASFSGWHETVQLSAPKDPIPAWLITPATSAT